MANDSEEPTALQKFFALNPSLVRGFLVTTLGLVVSVTGVAIDDKTTSLIINFVLAFFALGAALFIRQAVTPNAKVVIRDETPLDNVSTLVSGEATPVYTRDETIVELARKEAA